MCLNTIKSFKQKLNKKPVKEVKLSLAMFEEKAKEKEREKFIQRIEVEGRQEEGASE